MYEPTLPDIDELISVPTTIVGTPPKTYQLKCSDATYALLRADLENDIEGKIRYSLCICDGDVYMVDGLI